MVKIFRNQKGAQMKWYYYIMAIAVLCAVIWANQLGYNERQAEIALLKANQVTKGEDCSEGKLYTTYSFKDVVIYEPQYEACVKDKK